MLNRENLDKYITEELNEIFQQQQTVACAVRHEVL